MRTAQSAPRPGGFPLSQLAPTLLIDVVAPVVVFRVLLAMGVPLIWATAGGAIPPLVNNLLSWLRSRRLEPLGLLVVTFLVVGNGASLVTGDIFFTLIKDSLLTGTFGLIFLLSLFGKRPLMFYITRQFAAGDDAERLAWWNGLWEHDYFRGALQRLTAVWGVAYILEALARVAMALTMKPDQVLTLSPFMAFSATGALILFTRNHIRAARLRYEAENPEAA